MKKMNLVVIALLFVASASINALAQTEKKESTTAGAWRQAMPEAEETSNGLSVVMDESKDNVENRETTAETEKRILGLQRRLMEAHKQRDLVALKQLLADDFVPVGANLTPIQTDKTRYIEWAQKNLDLKSYTLGKITVRVYRTTALVTVPYKQQATIGGLPADGDFIATDVWVKRGKLWQAVSHHVSQISK